MTTGTERSANGAASRNGESFSSAGFMSAQWNGAETGSGRTRFAPRCFRSSDAFATAPAVPAMTVCSGELKFAAETASPVAEAISAQAAATAGPSRPMTAPMAPCPAGTASCMKRAAPVDEDDGVLERQRARRDERRPLAERVPREEGRGEAAAPCRTSKTATEWTRIAGCVTAVRFSSSSVPSNETREIDRRNGASAASARS